MENIIMNKQIDYSVITESPNLNATQEQLERLYQRYHFARQFAKNKDVLEVACGSGIGLGYLARVATKVVGMDIDEKNVELARTCYKEDERLRGSEDGRRRNGKIDIQIMDAHDLNFPAKCFDLVLLFEAIYYLKEPHKLISEAERVLRDNGKLIICTVNKDWDDFHPSPYTHKYFSVPELFEILKGKFNEIKMYGGFLVNKSGIKNTVVSRIKRTNSSKFQSYSWQPENKGIFKKNFYGKTCPFAC
ncbi:MAG: class I SAM-dependent methyltransferase [Candidatus Brocadia sapporoensis]